MYKSIIILVVLTLISGCAMAPKRTMLTPEYQARPALKTSLFSSDTEVLSEDALHRILSSKIELSENAKIAIMKFPSRKESSSLRYYGSYYWRTEGYLKLQQEYIQSLSELILKSPGVQEVILMPSLLTPDEATIPVLREAAVRLQADMLFVFSVTSDLYEKFRLFSKDQVKAYGTVEAVLLDVRTGLIPFTSVVTEDFLTVKEEQDMNDRETQSRAEKEAVLSSLKKIGDQTVDFLDSVP